MTHPERIGAPIACLLLLVGVVSGCAPERSEPGFAAGRQYTADLADEVFAQGYESIAERYVEPVSPETLAMSGLSGLSAIDPLVTVRRGGDRVLLSVVGREIARFPAPPADDVDGWARLTADVTAAAQKASRALADADPERLYEAVFDGALATLDAFSRYASAEEARGNRFRRDGYGGIGIRFRLVNGVARVVGVNADGPAYRAGLRVGDHLTRIDDAPVLGLSEASVADKLSGPAGTWVTVMTRRDGDFTAHRLQVHRAHIISETVSQRYADGIIYLTVDSFNQGTAGSMWSILDSLVARTRGRLKGVVLDLRGNPGGLLHQSVKVADLFLDHGRIIATQGRHPESVQTYEARGRDIVGGLPVVVVVDGGSASAAEVVAAALKDRGRAVVVGTTSYGKGTVQTVVSLANSGELTLTWSRLIMPSGHLLQGHGVLPTICTSGIRGDHDTAAEQAIAARSTALSASSSPAHACPAERRNDGLELKIARRLLADRAIYVQALDPTPDVADARY